MQAPQRAAAAIEGGAPLGIVRAKPLLKEGVGAEQTREKTPFVFHSFKLYEKKSENVQRPKQHCGSLGLNPGQIGKSRWLERRRFYQSFSGVPSEPDTESRARFAHAGAPPRDLPGGVRGLGMQVGRWFHDRPTRPDGSLRRDAVL